MRPRGSEIIFELKALDNLIRRQGDAHMRMVTSDEQLTRMHHWIIGYLYDHQDEEIYQKDIETEFKISRSTTSSMITLMEKKGLITRESVERDARLKRICLTEKAVEMHQKQVEHMRRMDAMIEGALTPEEKAQFMRSMGKIRTAVSEAARVEGSRTEE